MGALGGKREDEPLRRDVVEVAVEDARTNDSGEGEEAKLSGDDDFGVKALERFVEVSGGRNMVRKRSDASWTRRGTRRRTEADRRR